MQYKVYYEYWHYKKVCYTEKRLVIAAIDKQPKENVWFSDPQEICTPGYGLCMSAEDMAKIGQLCVCNGVFDGKQIISDKCIKEILVPRTIESGNFRGMSYGYLWWIIHPERNIFAAIGNSGNIIYVDPKRELVVAVSAYFKPTVFDRVDFIESVLLPTLQNEKLVN